MGLPYENLSAIIAAENQMFGGQDQPDLQTWRVKFHGNWYKVHGAGFVRSIEPFNQELCDAIIAADDAMPFREGSIHQHYDSIEGIEEYDVVEIPISGID